MVRKIRKLQEDEATGSESAEAIAANEDLLTLILLFFPVKSLVRFKSVSKNWLSIISSPHFVNLKSKRFNKDISGLFLRRIYKRLRRYKPKYEFIPLEDVVPRPIRSPIAGLDFVTGGIELVQYCNGLLLCKGPWKSKQMYYVFNPSTKQYTQVPVNRILESGKEDTPLYVNLAFDPRKSSHYKIICLYRSLPWTFPATRFELEIYSSETGFLRPVDGCLCRNGPHRYEGLYWNGAVIWFDFKFTDNGLYFNVDEEQLGTLPMPPKSCTPRRISYYGESNDHLHLIQTAFAVTAKLDVYELERDYSGWFVKFRVDLQPVINSFSESLNHEEHYMCCWKDSVGVLGVIRKDDDKESFLVLSMPRKVIKFSLADGSFSKLRNLAAENDHVYEWRQSFQFIGSLHCL